MFGYRNQLDALTGAAQMTLALLILAIPAAFALGWRARGEYEAAGRMRREPDEHERGSA